MLTAVLIAAALIASVLIAVLVLWLTGFFPEPPCKNSLFFADDTSMCVPSNKATLLRSREEFVFTRRPKCRYYVIKGGKKEEITTTLNDETMIVAKRDADVYFLVSDG